MSGRCFFGTLAASSPDPLPARFRLVPSTSLSPSDLAASSSFLLDDFTDSLSLLSSLGLCDFLDLGLPSVFGLVGLLDLDVASVFGLAGVRDLGVPSTLGLAGVRDLLFSLIFELAGVCDLGLRAPTSPPFGLPGVRDFDLLLRRDPLPDPRLSAEPLRERLLFGDEGVADRRLACEV